MVAARVRVWARARVRARVWARVRVRVRVGVRARIRVRVRFGLGRVGVRVRVSDAHGGLVEREPSLDAALEPRVAPRALPPEREVGVVGEDDRHRVWTRWAQD